MRAMQLQSLDGPDALELVDIPAPAPAAGEVLIAVRAAGVSFVDFADEPWAVPGEARAARDARRRGR
jgi:D-arabinose 1-dehydrogenase-like Zn-dependent alcohol dehydrogenase